MNFKKKRFSKLLEKAVNELKKEPLEEFYGKNTKIKILNLDYITSSNKMIVDTSIILGDVINEEILDISMADLLIRECSMYIFPDCHIMTIVKWDV